LLTLTDWGFLRPEIPGLEDELEMKQFRHSRQSNEELVRMIDNYVNEHGDASMGTIERELNVSISKQYKLSLAYRDRYPLLRLKLGFWRNRLVIQDEIIAVPRTSQDTLTGV
jgi:hypothetical protein